CFRKRGGRPLHSRNLPERNKTSTSATRSAGPLRFIARPITRFKKISKKSPPNWRNRKTKPNRTKIDGRQTGRTKPGESGTKRHQAAQAGNWPLFSKNTYARRKMFIFMFRRIYAKIVKESILQTWDILRRQMNESSNRIR